jgi:hypothetical protein
MALVRRLIPADTGDRLDVVVGGYTFTCERVGEQGILAPAAHQIPPGSVG